MLKVWFNPFISWSFRLMG